VACGVAVARPPHQRVYGLYDFTQAHRLVPARCRLCRALLPTPTRLATGAFTATLAHALFLLARDLHHGKSSGRERSEKVYAFDWTTLDRCRSLFPWGQFLRRPSAGKFQPLLDVLAAFRAVLG